MRQAVVLVGGLGTRLQSLGLNVPKPLVNVAAAPFLDHVLRQICRFGFKEVLLLAGHQGERVSELYHGKRKYGAKVEVLVEPDMRGTGGALVHALRQNRLDQSFFVTNGDTLFHTDLTKFVNTDLGRDSCGRLLLKRYDDPDRYGTVTTSEDGRVVSFEEKRSRSGSQLISAGAYILTASAIEEIASVPCPFSIESDVFPSWGRQGRLEFLESEGYFVDIGIPETYFRASREVLNAVAMPAAFLDRDGVINVDSGYTHRPDQLAFTSTAIKAIRSLNSRGFYVIVVSNQSGVARGYYSANDVESFHLHMQSELMMQGAHIDAFYYCPHHPAGTVAEFASDHPDRKPRPGMIKRALSDWPIQAERSFLVGDKPTDLAAAEAAGIRAYLMPTNSGDLESIVDVALRS